MSRISGIRMININYNNNSMKIDDEYYDVNGENTLISLRNGGGKSVLVQMLIAPFVHKRYRNTADRPFSSFFTTNKPSFVMVEWLLDSSGKRLMTGMMIRKNQETKEEIIDELEIFTFIHEYKEQGQYDIRSFPVIDEAAGKKQLKGFQSCKKILEECKQNNNLIFNYYDMNNSGQQKSYFSKLLTYQINHKEWETIIKRVNLKESGLSELFTEAKDEHGLVEKWFLPAIEDKLNQEENRMGQFEDIIGKYIKQYKDNKSKLTRKETILQFKEDTKKIYEYTEEYKDSLYNKTKIENNIATLITKLNELKQNTTDEKLKLKEESDNYKRNLKNVNFEKDSLEIYKKKDELDKYIEDLEKKDKIISDILSEMQNIQKKLYILQCSKYYLTYQKNSEEVLQFENMLEFARKRGEDLLPEKNNIGYNLRLFYEKEEKRIKKEIETLEEQYKNLKKEIDNIKDTVQKLNKKEKQNERRIGELKAEIKNYDSIEIRFNNSYAEDLARNILGFYENGFLTELGHKYKKVSEEKNKLLTERKKKIIELEQTKQKNERDAEDYQKIINIKTTKLHQAENHLEDYNKELEERKPLFKLLSVPDDNLFNKDKLLSAFNEKTEEANDLIYSLQREAEELSNQHKKIKTGKMLELSKELEEALDEAGIRYIYGMDWLNKNSYKTVDNKKLVKENPFLPYSLIMSAKECEKLIKSSLNVFTTFPIPVVIRENLENILSEAYYSMSDTVKFYICFNDRLLDENEVSIILNEIDEKINDINGKIERKKGERRYYNNQRDILQKQSVTEEDYNRCKNDIKSMKDEINKTEELLFDTKDRLTHISNDIKQNDKECRTLESDLLFLEQKQKEFTHLREQYDIYLTDRDEMTVLERQNEEFSQKIKELEKDITTKQDELNEKVKNMNDKKYDLDKANKEVSTYSSYKEGEVINKDIEDLIAKFNAIAIESVEEEFMNTQLIKANERFKKSEDELINYAKRYNIAESEYKQTIYDRFVEEELDDKLRTKEKQKEEESKTRAELDKKKAVTEYDITQSMQRFTDEYHTDILKSKEEIIIRDFEEDISKWKIAINEKEEELNKTEKQIDIYDNNLSNLAEYDLFQTSEEVVFTEPIHTFGKEEWNKFRGKMVRDYKEADKNSEAKKQQTAEIIREVLNNPQFLDEFYLNPLKRFDELKTNPDMLLEQIKLVWNSFDNLLEKLEIDLAFLGSEKEKITEILLDYIKAVHHHMNGIDKNSSIPVRGRSIKMLRIKVPDWEEQEEVYHIRTKDLLELIFENGLRLLEENNQIEEMIGKQMTTRNIYDQVVGIGNVEIRLYKIEEQREYPISWAEVAKNSGGEGFLSAFVILSSLLSFMRRDDTDIFAEKEESKVLIMDNPFAQTSASHLLKPLIEVAQKSHTQLICLTGLSGESIYNRFDQIFVLNLIPSSLNNNLAYLKSEQIKGEENSFYLTAARLKVEEVEQMTLF